MVHYTCLNFKKKKKAYQWLFLAINGSMNLDLEDFNSFALRNMIEGMIYELFKYGF